MTNYKMTNYNYHRGDVRWFSDKKTALAYGKMAVAAGYYPHFEELDEEFKTVKVVHFFTLAVKHFFKGGMF